MITNPEFSDPRVIALTASWLRERFSLARAFPLVEEEAVPQALTPAAVLLPVVERPQGLTVLFTERAAHLNDHPGQVSFPGGRREADDPTPVFTALRETSEEIGLAPEHVEVLGMLPEYRTGTGFSVTPVVGLLHPPFELKPDSFEVAEIFETPLAFLLDPANHQHHQVEFRGRLRQYYAMPYQGHFIWGATAGMLVSLYRLLMTE